MAVLIRKYQPPPKWTSAGGVVFAAATGEFRKWIYLIKPAHHLAPWGLPKGRVDLGETLAETAVREVREEVGIEARICGPYLGKHEGTCSVTHYFCMAFKRVVGVHSWETEDVRLVHIDRAIHLARAVKNKRDFKVLTLAKKGMGY